LLGAVDEHRLELDFSVERRSHQIWSFEHAHALTPTKRSLVDESPKSTYSLM
jgi:hypothetical protein